MTTTLPPYEEVTTRYIRSSASVGAMIWKPTGSPSERPHGTEMAGPP